MTVNTLEGTKKAVLLVGGMGTRLRSVLHSVPKPLAPVGNKSILELLVLQLRKQGFRHLIMCTGYLADQIEAKFGDGGKWDVDITYSRETSPAGTAGAVRLAQTSLRDDTGFVVMNGDSFIEIDLSELLNFHYRHCCIASIAVRKVENTARYGTVQVDAGRRVTGFFEKTGKDVPGLVNAGVYVFSRAVLDRIPEGPASLERDVFPALLHEGVYALEARGLFVDIGTPEAYALAQDLCDRLFDAAIGARWAATSRTTQG